MFVCVYERVDKWRTLVLYPIQSPVYIQMPGLQTVMRGNNSFACVSRELMLNENEKVTLVREEEK